MKLVNTPDLGSGAERFKSSSLLLPTKTNDTKTFESFVKGYYPKSYDQIMENIVHCTVKITDDYKLGIKVGKKTFKNSKLE